MSNMKKETIKTAILLIIGAVCGFVYYIFWGCVDNCAIRSNVYLMTIYGAIFGILFSLLVPMSFYEKIWSKMRKKPTVSQINTNQEKDNENDTENDTNQEQDNENDTENDTKQ